MVRKMGNKNDGAYGEEDKKGGYGRKIKGKKKLKGRQSGDGEEENRKQQKIEKRTGISNYMT